MHPDRHPTGPESGSEPYSASMGKRALLAVVVCAAFPVASASAGPYFTSSSPRVGRPGDVVTLHAGLGVKLSELMPLYLVPVRLAPHPYLCQHGKATCEPTARRAPHRAPFVRVATLDVRHARGSPAAGYDVTIRYRIPPAMRPGRYAYVLYCRWCARKGLGSLITWPTRAGAGKTIRSATALIVRHS